MSDRFRHAGHLVRVASVVAVGFVAFVLLRGALVPADFGVYGFYRAGALGDIASQPPAYGGAQTCLVCHSDVAEARAGSRHVAINCEACHGALARHASGDFDQKPLPLDPRRLCLQCHTRLAAKPAAMPQIVPADHGGDGPCTDCHQPHHPKIG